MTVESESTITIDDQETPLGAMSGDNIHPWWSWVPVIGGALGILDGLKKKKDEEEEEEKPADENESDDNN